MERHGRTDRAVLANSYDISKTASEPVADPNELNEPSRWLEPFTKLDDHGILPSELASSPFVSKSNCAFFVEPSDFYNYVRKQFVTYESSHNAMYNRVLIWGPDGNGKRQFAIYFAKRFAPTRHILWLEGSHSATFVRDLCNAYRIVTANPIPKGVNITWLLQKIQTTLSEHRQSWFMVILDLNSKLSHSSNNETGLNLTSYLPTGQILITHSTKLLYNVVEEVEPIYTGNLKIPHLSNTVRVKSWSLEFANACSQRACSSNINSEKSMCKTSSNFDDHLLTLSLLCGTARLAEISLEQARSLLCRKLAEAQQFQHVRKNPVNLLLRFHCVLELFMENLRNTSLEAEVLLLAIVAVDNHDVSVSLLAKLPVLKEGLENAIDILQSCSMLHVREHDNGERYVNMHRSTYGYFVLRAREAVTDGESQLLDKVVSQWIDVLDDNVHELPENLDRTNCWSRLHMVLSIFDISRAMNVCTQSLVSLLRKTGTFLNESLVMPTCTTRIIARAQLVCSILELRASSSDLDVQYIQLNRERSKLASLLGENSRALSELARAKKALESLTVPTAQLEELRQSIFDEEITQLLRQDCTQITAQMVHDELKRDSKLDTTARRAQLHTWYACSTSSLGSGAMIRPLQHSHLALSYWNTLSEDEKWGSKNFCQLAWIDTHAGILMQMDKSRGALVFLPRLLQANIDHCPSNHHNIWRLAYCTVREYVYIHEYEEAEKVAIRVLSLCDKGPGSLRGITLTWAILMLHMLGVIFRSIGRLVEAEGMFRWCLESIEEQEPPSVVDQTKLFLTGLWTELFQVLHAQGKMEEAQAVCEIALEKGCNQLQDTKDREIMIRTETTDLYKQYDRALQAARDRLANVYNQDDSLLELFPKDDFVVAIKLFGDPFDRIEHGDEDFRNDIRCIQKCSGADSIILDLLDFEWTDRVSGKFENGEKPNEQQTKWEKVFESELNIINVRRQSRLWNYWRWCDCRRRRWRSSSTARSTIQDRKRTYNAEAEHSLNGKEDGPTLHQASMYAYVIRRPKYDPRVCGPSCPCIEANIQGKKLTEQIEAERLFQYKSCDIAANEAEHQFRFKDLQRYQRKFGRRPALPYGMFFSSSWSSSRKRGRSKARNERHHELLWVSDYILRGDSTSSAGFHMHDENYLLINPAMREVTRSQVEQVYDLPDISITAETPGEKVRQNEDRWTSRWRNDWHQRDITQYFKPQKRSRPHEHISVTASTHRSVSPSHRHHRSLELQKVGSKPVISEIPNNSQVDRQLSSVRNRSASPEQMLSDGSKQCLNYGRSCSEDHDQSKGTVRSDSISSSRSTMRSCSGGTSGHRSLSRSISPRRRLYRSGSDRAALRSLSPIVLDDTSDHSDNSESDRASQLSTAETHKQKKLEIFDIGSIHSLGPIFDWGEFSLKTLRGWQQRLIKFPYHDSDEETPSEAEYDFYKVHPAPSRRSRSRASRNDSRSPRRRRRSRPFRQKDQSPENSITIGTENVVDQNVNLKTELIVDGQINAYADLGLDELDPHQHEPHRCSPIMEDHETLDITKLDSSYDEQLPVIPALQAIEVGDSVRDQADDNVNSYEEAQISMIVDASRKQSSQTSDTSTAFQSKTIISHQSLDMQNPNNTRLQYSPSVDCQLDESNNSGTCTGDDIVDTKGKGKARAE